MKLDLDYELGCLYEKWLLEEYPDEVHNKEKLMEMWENQVHYEEFQEAIRKVL